MPVDAATSNETAVDALLDGRLRLHQPVQGHRAGSDAVLLAAAAPSPFEGHAIDLGAGVGTAGLIVGLLNPGAHIDLIENEPEAALCAETNVRENGQTARARVQRCDLFDRAAMAPFAGVADLVLTNPPFLDPARTRLPRDARRRAAHAMPAESLPGWIAAAGACLKPGGVLIVIHRADAVPGLLAACHPMFGELILMPLLPEHDRPARRILLRAVKGSGAPFSIAPPLVLHADGAFTPLAAAIHRGTARVVWPAAQ